MLLISPLEWQAGLQIATTTPSFMLWRQVANPGLLECWTLGKYYTSSLLSHPFIPGPSSNPPFSSSPSYFPFHIFLLCCALPGTLHSKYSLTELHSQLSLCTFYPSILAWAEVASHIPLPRIHLVSYKLLSEREIERENTGQRRMERKRERGRKPGRKECCQCCRKIPQWLQFQGAYQLLPGCAIASQLSHFHHGLRSHLLRWPRRQFQQQSRSHLPFDNDTFIPFLSCLAPCLSLSYSSLQNVLSCVLPWRELYILWEVAESLPFRGNLPGFSLFWIKGPFFSALVAACSQFICPPQKS